MEHEVVLALFSVLVAVGVSGMAGAGERTYAERLGWDAGSVVVIFHIDDAGMSHSSNLGTVEALNGGLATSYSVMAPCAWLPEFASLVRDRPGMDAGVHLTLTSEFEGYRWSPLAGARQVPGLVDEAGCFWRESVRVVERASAGEVDLEMRVQVERVERLGIRLTHLDTHMGVLFRSPAFFDCYVRLGVEKRLPVLVSGGHSTHAIEANGEAVRQLSPLAEKIWEAGLPVIDDIHALSYRWPSAEKKGRFKALVESLRPGITEIIVHPARLVPGFEAISDSGPTREADLEAMLDPELRELVDRRGIVLTSWGELMERRGRCG